ncbi:Hsp20/alpha crystallin family protein [Azospirillum agricola]|uniref:Hsp20/alpha crystallin family protein n=1 Tax=Azospirillum agricola TaxID=1720247 RepID=UPI000A0F15A3|nr:Hsp20/alpha crystallin family protein [Azospirillum agricola]SMH46107.1 heat shock protein Hsp20 [Azospirillum lipoferum]
MADANVTAKPQEEKPRQEVASTGTAAQQIAVHNRNPILALRDEFDRLFDEASSMLHLPWSRRAPFDLEPLLRTGLEGMAFAPPAEVDDRESEYRVTMELPGMDAQSIDLTVQNDFLSVKAEKREEKEEKGASRTFSERRYGLCARTFRLPADVDRDRIAASMKNGVLTLTLPKTASSQPARRQIDIKQA